MGYLKLKPCITLLILLFSNATIEAKTTFDICYEANHYPPYIFNKGGIPSGILVDILEFASTKSNVNITLYSNSWTRCQQDVISGKAHALFAMVITPEREKVFSFPPSKQLATWYMWEASYPIFTPSSLYFNIEEYTPLKGIGAPLGYVVWDILKKKEWLSPYQYEPIEGLKMLSLKRLDGYVVEKYIGLRLLQENNLTDKVTMNNYSLLNTKWYLSFNKEFYRDNRNTITHFWEEMAIKRKAIETELRAKK